MGTNGQTAYDIEEDQGQNNFIELKLGGASQSNNLNHSEPKNPLVYYRGKYRHLAPDYQRPSLAAYYDEDFE
jgi:hypothetical protein